MLTSSHPANDSGALDGAVNQGNHPGELGLIGGVEVLGPTKGNEAVGVGQARENPNLARVFKLDTWMGQDGERRGKTGKDGLRRIRPKRATGRKKMKEGFSYG